VPEFRKKPVVVEAMQMPFDTRVAPGPDEPTCSELQAKVRDIAVWMGENGYDGNPDGEELTEWPEDDVIVNSDGSLTGLAEHGMNFLEIQTLEGTMTASPGDWIIKGVQGEFYPCKPDIFEQTYEAV